MCTPKFCTRNLALFELQRKQFATPFQAESWPVSCPFNSRAKADSSMERFRGRYGGFRQPRVENPLNRHLRPTGSLVGSGVLQVARSELPSNFAVKHELHNPKPGRTLSENLLPLTHSRESGKYSRVGIRSLVGAPVPSRREFAHRRVLTLIQRKPLRQ